MSDETIVCPNGHSRKFYATYTHVAFKVVKDANGQQQHVNLKDKVEGAIMMFHCADCGATVVQEVDREGKPVKETV